MQWDYGDGASQKVKKMKVPSQTNAEYFSTMINKYTDIKFLISTVIGR